MKLTRAKLSKQATAAKAEFRRRMARDGRAATGSHAEVVAFGAAPPSDGSNVLGCGYGIREHGGASGPEELALRVYVRSKLPLRLLSASEVIPSSFDGTWTDVIEVGDIASQVRPAPGGSSIGHVSVAAGTLGCLVRKRDSSGGNFILSNNHILADHNRAAIGDTIVEPGPVDGGTSKIARLSDFEPLRFDGSANRIDAAIAEVDPTDAASATVTSIGVLPAGTMSAALFQSVRKSGRTTRHTIGVVMDVSADIKIRYGTQIASFEDLISVQGLGGPFSDRGDSGSLVVDGVSAKPVALLVGGSAAASFACSIDEVLDRFGVEIFSGL